MSTVKKYSFKKKIFLLLLSCFLFVALVVVYELFFNKPHEVKGSILQPQAVFTKHTDRPWAVCFHPDATLVFSAGVDSTVKIWDRKTLQVIHQLKQPQGITSLDISTGGSQVVTASYDGIVRIWDWKAEKLLREFRGHSGPVWSVVFSADGRKIASSGEDKIVRLWDVTTGKLLRTFGGHERNIWKVCFSPDGTKVISSSFDNSIKIWNTDDGALIHTLKGHTEAVVGLAISPDGTTIASGSDDKTVKLWELNSGKLIRTIDGYEHVYSVAFSPDGKWLAGGCKDKGTVGEILQNFFGDSDKNKGVSIRLWDVVTSRLVQTLSEHGNEVMDVSFSADGRWLGSASTDKTVRLWRVNQ